MKNLAKISLLAVMAAGCLIGCNNNKKQSGGDGLDKSAEGAVSTVGVAYSGYAGSDGISIGGGKLIQSQAQGNYQFDITYTVAPLSATYSHTYLAIEGEKLVVEIPTFDELKADNATGTYAAYKLTGSFKYAKYLGEGKDADADKVGQEIKNHSWNIRINAEKEKPVLQKISVARNKEKGETVVTKGYITAFMNNVDGDEFKNGVWIGDGADGMMLYGGMLPSSMGTLEIGDLILMAGTASPYNGLFEVNPKSISKIDDPAIGSDYNVSTPVWTELDEAGIKALDAEKADDQFTIPNVTLTGIEDLKDKSSMEFGGTVGSTSFAIYVNKHTNAAQRTALLKHLQDNKDKTVTLKVIGGWNNSAFQFTVAQITKDGNLNDCFQFAA